VTRPSRSRIAIAAAVALTLLLAACGSKSTSSSTPSSTASASRDLKIGFVSDMQVPDPDIFYEVEGNLVVTSVYEGLVRYKPDSTEIEGALATDWTVSPDGMTYTFKIRPGVTFASGAPMDATSWVKSFKRRTDVNSAPAYMLADVASTSATDPQTFVVKLKNPVSPFLDYLAAPYGPKAVDFTVLDKQGGSDFGQSYLATHSAGTGPYVISKFEVGQGYQLTSNPTYWGGAPFYETVDISIIPDMATQRLKLESGELDMVLHGMPVADVESFRSQPGFQVMQFPVLLKTAIAANPNKGPFQSAALRKALQESIDKSALTQQIYQSQATASAQIYPAGMLPSSMAQDVSTINPDALKAAVDALPADQRKVDMGYSEDEGGTIPRIAETVAAQLKTAGLDVTVRGIPIAQVFDLPNQTATAPDLLMWTFNPDAAHPDTWIRIFMNTKGSLNFLQCSVPEADALMDQGLVATDKTAMQDLYGKAGDAVVASGCFTTVADNQDVVISRSGITGFVHQLPTPYTVRLKDLKAG
jgi:peptide/nickel transport system substrate-binding protein